MARKSRTAVLKRQREVRKAEKAAAKREKRVERDSESTDANRVATADDLEGYGFGGPDDTGNSDTSPPRLRSPEERKRPWLKNR
ncbi:MAG: hypothetical protein OEM05_08975 [Myxococcales bacterium]|nr:hypothetical protein [Myxococcales bacterium]